MTPVAIDLATGAALAAVGAFAAHRLGLLTAGGAVGAAVIGALTFGLGGWEWALLLVIFFATSSAVTQWQADEKAEAGRTFAKGGRRDLGQVLANGGLPALLAILHWRWPDAWLFAAYTGALAVATADTWATEVGLLAEAPPRLVTSGRIVRPGTSGGVTVLGTVAAVVGAAVIGLSAAVLYSLRDVVTFGGLGLWDASGLPLLPIGALAGLVGTAVDSLLGATLQAQYRSSGDRGNGVADHAARAAHDDGVPHGGIAPSPHGDTERATALDGTRNERVRGWGWMTNDVVNVVAVGVGGVVAWGLHLLL